MHCILMNIWTVFISSTTFSCDISVLLDEKQRSKSVPQSWWQGMAEQSTIVWLLMKILMSASSSRQGSLIKSYMELWATGKSISWVQHLNPTRSNCKGEAVISISSLSVLYIWLSLGLWGSPLISQLPIYLHLLGKKGIPIIRQILPSCSLF